MSLQKCETRIGWDIFIRVSVCQKLSTSNVVWRSSWENKKNKKDAVFLPNRVFTATADSLLELGNTRRPQETRIMGLSGRGKSLTASLAIWIQYTNVTDRQTDERTDTYRQQWPRLRIASRGKYCRRPLASHLIFGRAAARRNLAWIVSSGLTGGAILPVHATGPSSLPNLTVRTTSLPSWTAASNSSLAKSNEPHMT